MNRARGLTYHAAAFVSRVVLVVALAAGVWSIYDGLPADGGATLPASVQPTATALRVVLRRTESANVSARRIPVQLYPINVAAARREFDSEHRPGVRFEDFMTKRMGSRQPLTGELDEHGETVMAVPPGKWWVHATLDGAEELTWRLPVNVTGREKTVELTPENAYTRAKTF